MGRRSTSACQRSCRTRTIRSAFDNRFQLGSGMRKFLLVVPALGGSVFATSTAGAGSVSDTVKAIGAATQSAAKGASSSTKTVPPTRPVQSMKTPSQFRSVDGETKERRHPGE